MLPARTVLTPGPRPKWGRRAKRPMPKRNKLEVSEEILSIDFTISKCYGNFHPPQEFFPALSLGQEKA